MKKLKLLIISIIILLSVLGYFINKQIEISGKSYISNNKNISSGNRCYYEFRGDNSIFIGKKEYALDYAFPANTGELKNLDKESFVFMYEDKDIYEYSTILCFYKDKNYVYGLEADRFIPLFTNFDYDTIEILLSYNEFRQKKTSCGGGGCFADKENVFISTSFGRSSSEDQFGSTYDIVKKENCNMGSCFKLVSFCKNGDCFQK